ncbi:MAG: peptidylprolyl isomerase [Labilithrix sp.]|nr:peptidylprolyl isomerase [Labilithrix sp.]MCW5833452.1 peptidylprolyl isomerase [Labilithrix sp.]
MRLARIVARSFSRSLVAGVAVTACASTGSSGGGSAPAYPAAPAMTIDTSKTYSATMVTSRGTIELSLDAKAAPITVNNFVFLARDGYYDGLTFHRVEPGFVIQGGDPDGDGSGGPGYQIPDEASGLPHVDGALAMAKSAAPNSAGSQFYITLGPQAELDGRYTVFGAVTAGKEVARLIQVGDAITSVTITEQ